MKRVLMAGLFLVVAAAVVMAGGTGENKGKGKQLLIGVALPSAAQERWLLDAEGFKKAAEKAGVKVIIQFANDDEKLQASQIENIVTQGVDGLIIDPVNMDAAKTQVDMLFKQKIPVVSYDRCPLNSQVAAYVNRDNYAVGYGLAQAAYAFAPKGNYVFCWGDEVNVVAHQKKAGVEAFLKQYIDKGDIKVVSAQFNKAWSTELALKQVENALTANNNNIQAVVSINDSQGLGALQALTTQGLAGKVFLSGEDAEVPMCQAIVEGRATTSFYTPIPEWTALTMETMLKVVRGEKLQYKLTFDNGLIKVPVIEIKAIGVTKANMVDVIIKSGYHKAEDVYANIPKDQWPAM